MVNAGENSPKKRDHAIIAQYSPYQLHDLDAATKA